MMEEIELIIEDSKERMDKSIEAYIEDLKTVRTGRASLSILEQIRIDCYGSQMPINQMANLSIPDPRSIAIEPWDKSTIQDIERGLLKSDLNLTPSNDGNIIRLNFPPLTEERRQDFVKHVRSRAENGKVAIRNIRRDANEEIKSFEKDGHISKDDVKHAHDDIQKKTDQYIEKISQITENKVQEIMEI